MVVASPPAATIGQDAGEVIEIIYYYYLNFTLFIEIKGNQSFKKTFESFQAGKSPFLKDRRSPNLSTTPHNTQ